MRGWLAPPVVCVLALAGGLGVRARYWGVHDGPAGSAVGRGNGDAVANGDAVVDGHPPCQVDGPELVTVPNLVGRPLPAAVAVARANGLSVVGQGIGSGDPTGAAALVLAQEPAAGLRVPAGACLGFRTGR